MEVLLVYDWVSNNRYRPKLFKRHVKQSTPESLPGGGLRSQIEIISLIWEIILEDCN